MKLILTSKDFLNEKSKQIIVDNLGMKIEHCKILFIPPAKATKEDLESDKYLKRMESYGFQKENIMVFDYDNSEKFNNLNIDAIYVGGGNTFQLLDRIRKSKFDQKIMEYIKNGVIYIGGSAGTHLASKNIKHVLDFDENIVNLTDFNALGLFDGIVFCHYTKEREKYYLKAVKESNYPVYRLKDDEAIIISN